MTSSQAFLFIVIIAAVGQSCSALFYTTSNKDEYPRIGKRLLQLINIRKSPNERYRTAKRRDQLWKPEPQVNPYLWRPILSSILESDTFGGETLSDEDMDVLQKMLRLLPRYASQSVQEHKDKIKRQQQLQSLSLENGSPPPEY